MQSIMGRFLVDGLVQRLSGLLIPFVTFTSIVLISISSYTEDGDPPDTESCYECHDTDEVDGEEVALDQRLASSVHEGFDCVDCHADATNSHDEKEEELALVDCGSCHTDEYEDYQAHGRMELGEDEDIPGCTDCHGSHLILSSADATSPTHRKNLPNTCGNCHGDIDLTKKHEILYGKAVEVYQSSVHGLAATEGVIEAATCKDCHFTDGSAHKIYGPADKLSTINHFNIPNTCSKCHSQVGQDYWEGIHGQFVARGETYSPVCTNCHGEHGIVSPSDPRSAVSPVRVAEATCTPCHESAYLNERFTGPNGKLRSWYDSYHGLKSKAGDVTVANCASCHEAHLILPHTDPNSSIYSENLQSTCGKCHPGITAAIAATPIHAEPGIVRTPIANVIKNIYIIIIIVVVGGMLLYCLIDYRKHVRQMNLQPQVRRMSNNAVWQHAFLMLTFAVLIISGFSLRHSEAWWANLLFSWEGGSELRGLIHRIAAALFIVTVLWHLIYLATQKGRQFLRAMMPARLDLTQLIQMVGYNIGTSKERPAFGRFSYVEKVEYWALAWGTVLMVITGFMLWFENDIIRWFSEGFLDVMLVIHYYEAWLAMLAILVWHLYATVLNPAVYPMNPSWLTGKMPLEQYLHEHPGDSAFEQNEAADSPDCTAIDPTSESSGETDEL